MTAIRGIYAITPDYATDAELQTAAAAALAGGVQILQYRQSAASSSATVAARRAVMLASLCRRAGVPLIINNDIALAKASGASGVHLGQSDGSVAAARRLLGADAIIGKTCHNDLSLARAAAASGADYIAVGAMYPSVTKPSASRCSLPTLTMIKRAVNIPVVAVGGITADNIAAVIAAGADAIAVIHGLFSAPDIAAAARELGGIYAKRCIM